MNTLAYVVAAVAGIVGVALGFLLSLWSAKAKKQNATRQAEEIVKDAESES